MKCLMAPTCKQRPKVQRHWFSTAFLALLFHNKRFSLITLFPFISFLLLVLKHGHYWRMSHKKVFTLYKTKEKSNKFPSAVQLFRSTSFKCQKKNNFFLTSLSNWKCLNELVSNQADNFLIFLWVFVIENYL